MASWVCIDASVIIRSLIPMEQSGDAIDLLRAWRRQGVSLTSTTLLACEVTSVLRNHVFRGAISAESAGAALTSFRKLPVRYASHTTLVSRAWELARQLNRPNAYDGFYLAVAERLGGTFWTADKRLYNAAHQTISWIHLLGEPADGGQAARS